MPASISPQACCCTFSFTCPQNRNVWRARLLVMLMGCTPDSLRICFTSSGACLCGGISSPLASLLCYRSMCLIQSTSIISVGTLTYCMSLKTTWISILSRLLLGGGGGGVLPPPPMQSRPVFSSYYQTVIHVQIYSNRLHNSDARGRWGLDSRLVLWTPHPCTPYFKILVRTLTWITVLFSTIARVFQQ